MAKPRTDLKDENERLKLKIDRLEQENGALRSEKEEVSTMYLYIFFQ